MTFLHSLNGLYVASGFLVGGIVGLTGVGGGALMTPILVLLFGVSPVTAVGTDLLYACLTKVGGSTVHAFNRTIDWAIVRRLATGSVPAALLTILALKFLGADSSSTKLLVTRALGPALLLTALSLVFRKYLLDHYARRTGGLSSIVTRNLTILTGALLGTLVTISSVGAGALGVTALILLYPSLPVARIVGSDIAHAVPLTFVAGAGHWFLGTTDLSLLSSLLAGSLPGIVIASYLAPRVPETVLRYLLAVVLALVGVKMLT